MFQMFHMTNEDTDKNLPDQFSNRGGWSEGPVLFVNRFLTFLAIRGLVFASLLILYGTTLLIFK